MAIKELLATYYEGLAQKKGWDTVLADDFKFVGADMTNTRPLVGKPAVIEVINRFSNLFKSMRVKDMIIEGERASVRANYEFAFPNGKSVNGDVVELWYAKSGRLDTLTIFYDTATFAALSKD